MASRASKLERWRSVYPENGRLLVRRVKPAMAAVALEPETVALLEQVTFDLIKPDFQRAFEHEKKVFALVHVRAIASGSWWNPNQHGFEHLRACRKQFHADAGLRFQALAIPWLDHTVGLRWQVIEFQYSGAICRCQSINCGHGGVRTREFDGTEEAGGNVGLASRLRYG